MSSAKPLISSFLSRNKQHAASHEPFPTFVEMAAAKAAPPRVLIITCADPRCNPQDFAQLETGDAIIMRNVCGHVAPIFNDILAVDMLFNLEECMVVHHTDCGALGIKDAAVREKLLARVPGDESVERMAFGGIEDVEQSVRDDLAVLKGSLLVRKEFADRASGWVYDIKTGQLSAVVL